MKRRESSISKPRDKYVYYSLIKEGDDWSRVRRRKLTAQPEQLEKLAKKGRKKVLEESKNMGSLRGQHFDMLVADVNKGESGDATWEPVYIKKERVSRKDRIEVKSMDVVLARTPIVVRSKSKSAGSGEVFDLHDKKSKDKSGKKDKGGSPHDHKRKDSKFDDDEDDPFQSKKLFHHTGKPMDNYGALHFENAGLPPEIPRDRPIGARSEKEKEKDFDRDGFKFDKGGKRSKSRDGGGGKLKQGVDDVIAGALGGGPGPLGDSLADILGEHKGGGGGGRSRGGSRAGDFPEVTTGDNRSQSRRRPSESRPRGSRSRSRATHPEEIRFPPEWDRDRRGGGGGGGGGGAFYSGGSSASSVSSDTSKFGYDRYDGSSHTSQDTYHSVTGRGSRYNDDDRHYYKQQDPRRGSYHQDDKVYKEHSRGPPLHRASTTYEPYRSAGSRRYSMNRGGYYHDPIPESRQIGYHDDPQPQPQPGPLVRRSTYDDGRRPVVFQSDMVDLKQRSADAYMNDNLRDHELSRREREVEKRERELNQQQRWEEEEEMKRREREERRYHDDRRYSSRGYDDYGDRY